MENIFQPMGFGVNPFSLNAFGNMKNAQSEANNCMDTTLGLNLLGSSSLYDPDAIRNKRKRSVVASEGPEEGFSLVLGLGRSPCSSDNSKINSAPTYVKSSAKESEESSMGLELSFQLHHVGGCTICPKELALVMAKPLETECDLQLSLSAGSSSSVITTASPSSAHKQNNSEMSASVSGASPVDEGSTSSRWTSGVSSLPHANSFIISLEDSSRFVNVDSDPSLPNPSSVTIQAPKSSVTSTSGITHAQQQRNTSSTRTCQFQGCGKGARGASGLCIAHGGGRRCQRGGCHKGAEGRTLFCKAHGGGRRCQSPGCTKSAEGRTNFCIGHGGGRRCSHEGCTRAARGKSGLCIRHGGGKRCQWKNCTKSAEGYSGLCISHGGGRRCQFTACTKGAQGSTMFCKAHGGGKRCTVLGCTKGAEGSTPFCKGHGGGKRCSFQGGGICPKSVHGGTLFCVAHGGGKRCAAPECTKSARGRTDFCVRHGGGKRCKSEGCGKSAQGRTDFCKAHGGGKRCSWGQVGSSLGSGGPPCERFARVKSGLCTAHSTLTQDHMVHGGVPLGLNASHVKKDAVIGDAFAKGGNHGWNFVGRDTRAARQVSPHKSGEVSLPEGRVHGGSLMALLASGVGIGNHPGHARASLSKQGAAFVMPHQWV